MAEHGGRIAMKEDSVNKQTHYAVYHIRQGGTSDPILTQKFKDQYSARRCFDMHRQRLLAGEYAERLNGFPPIVEVALYEEPFGAMLDTTADAGS